MNKTINRLLLSVAAVLMTISATAQEKIVNPDITYAGTPRSCVIGGISVSGVEGYEDYMLTGISGLTVGQTISLPGNELTEAVKKYWNYRLFSDVAIGVDSIVSDKVYLNIRLRANPRVSAVNYIGIAHRRQGLSPFLSCYKTSCVGDKLFGSEEVGERRPRDEARTAEG